MSGKKWDLDTVWEVFNTDELHAIDDLGEIEGLEREDEGWEEKIQAKAVEEAKEQLKDIIDPDRESPIDILQDLTEELAGVDSSQIESAIEGAGQGVIETMVEAVKSMDTASMVSEVRGLLGLP